MIHTSSRKVVVVFEEPTFSFASRPLVTSEQNGKNKELSRCANFISFPHVHILTSYILHSLYSILPGKKNQRHHFSSIFIHPPKKKHIKPLTKTKPPETRRPCRRLSLLHDTLPLHHHLDEPLECFWPPSADLELTVLVAAEDPNQPISVSPGRIVEIQRLDPGRGPENGGTQLTVRFVPGKLRAGMVDTWNPRNRFFV